LKKAENFKRLEHCYLELSETMAGAKYSWQ